MAEDTIKPGEFPSSLKNPHIHTMIEDNLMHLSIGTRTHDLKTMFGDVKFVVMGGTATRMKTFAHLILKELNISIPTGTDLIDISSASNRYSMYKVGPVLSVSHGIGIPSTSILLHEISKLLHYAECKDVQMIRVGTCGGVGIEPGSLVISKEVVDGLMRPYMEVAILGKIVRRPAGLLDLELAKDLASCKEADDPFAVHIGKTMCTNDFYEGQGRLDGAICDFTEVEKMEFLEKIAKDGVLNIEMESLIFATFCHRVGIRAAVICVSFLDRLQGDRVSDPKEILDEWQQRPLLLICRYIKTQLKRM